MNKPDYHLVSFSGGKDSTAMLLRMIEEGMQIDCILFCDTGLEFPAMYDHIKKVENYIGRKITTVKAKEDYEYLMLEKPIKRNPSSDVLKKYNGTMNGYGWAGPKMRWCTEKLKNQPRQQFMSSIRKQYNVIEYIGLAADEQYRLERKVNKRPNHVHPLVEWHMTESDCLRYCYERGFDWDGLYERFHRVSCWCCPLQSLNELRQLYFFYPELWKKLKEWDSKTWRTFKPGASVENLEKRFELEKEYKNESRPVNNKVFFSALKERLNGK